MAEVGVHVIHAALERVAAHHARAHHAHRQAGQDGPPRPPVEPRPAEAPESTRGATDGTR